MSKIHCVWRTVAFFAMALLSQQALAQNLRFQHISVNKGLSQSTVYNITQDKRAFMWFATGDGLNRYDGVDFVTYKSKFNDTVSGLLNDRNINSAIIEDSSNRLWISSDAGLSVMDVKSGKFSLVLGQREMERSSALAGFDGSDIWVFVNEKGLYRVNARSFQYAFYQFPDSLRYGSAVICAAIHSPGFVGMINGQGLIRFNKDKLYFEKVFQSTGCKWLIPLTDGRLLMPAINGVYLCSENKKVQFIPIRVTGIKNLQWKSCAENREDHHVWLSSDGGGWLCKLEVNTGKYEIFKAPQDAITSMFIDRTENLWMGTEGAGLYKLDLKPPKFYGYPTDPFDPVPEMDSLMVKSVYRDEAKKLWLGTFMKGVLIYDPSTGTVDASVKLPVPGKPHFVGAIIKDSSARMVIGQGNGVFWVDQVSHKIIQQVKLPAYYDPASGESQINSLIEISRNHYLAGTNNGLYIINIDRSSAYAFLPHTFYNNPDVGVWVYGVQKAIDGSILIGRRQGFAKFRLSDDTVITLLDKGFNQVGIRNFYESDRQPVMWLATEAGLVAYNYKTKAYRVFDEQNGLGNSFVYSVLAANDSSLWLSTNKGISHALVSYANGEANVHFVNYTVHDGLQSNEFNTGAYFKSGDGTLVFGSINGVNWFRPDAIQTNAHTAVPVLSSMLVNEKLYATDTVNGIDKITLTYTQNTIGFTFRALEYTSPERNSFAYKLDGLDNDWVYTREGEAHYSNLPPGKYCFMLRVSNNDGVWNNEPQQLSIVITPPFWQTWWFRLAILLAGVCLIYLAIRYYVGVKIRERTLQFEKQQALYNERMRISKDVHDDLGSGLSKISLMAELALKEVNGDVRLRNSLRNIADTSKNLVGNMRDLIWVLNPGNTTLDVLASRIFEYCSDYSEDTSLQIQMDFSENIPAIHLSREVQRNIFLTVKEALHNCVKHSGADKVEIQFRLDSEMIYIAVKDNGKGFSSEKATRDGNGLRNMKQRIETIGGLCDISSSGTGTSVVITMAMALLSSPGKT